MVYMCVCLLSMKNEVVLFCEDGTTLRVYIIPFGREHVIIIYINIMHVRKAAIIK